MDRILIIHIWYLFGLIGCICFWYRRFKDFTIGDIFTVAFLSWFGPVAFLIAFEDKIGPVFNRIIDFKIFRW